VRAGDSGLGRAHRAAQAARAAEVRLGIGLHRFEGVDLARQEVAREEAEPTAAAAQATCQRHPQGLAALDPDGLPLDPPARELEPAFAARAALVLEERTHVGACAVDVAEKLATL
jgi:hypothetical protein